MIQWRERYESKKLDIKEAIKVEEWFGVKFPKEYVECIIENDGASPEQSCIDVSHNERVFSLLECSQIIETFNSIKDTLPNEGNKIVPMGEDPAGNKYCFDFRKNFNEPSIVFWYHEQAYSEEDFPNWELRGIDIEKKKEEVLHYVCGSFKELLEKLHYPEGYEERLTPKIQLKEVFYISNKFNLKFPYGYMKLAVFFSGEKIYKKIKVEKSNKILTRILSYGQDTYNVENIYNNIKNIYSDKMFPIIEDSEGNYVCLDYRNNINEPVVVYIEKDINGYEVKNICDKFHEFLEMTEFDKILFR